MNTIEKILLEINSLNEDEKVEIYKKLRNDLIKSREKIIDISRYKGISKGLWGEDAQNYVDKIRANDRI